MSLHRFESFIPKNLDQRKEKMRLIKEKELKELNEMVSKLSNIISTFKDLKIDDEKEQLFIRKFINCQIKIDNDEYPNEIFFFDNKDKYLASYDSKNQEFWISYENIWFLFERVKDQVKAKDWIEKYFKLRSTVTIAYRQGWLLSVIEHFKSV